MTPEQIAAEAAALTLADQKLIRLLPLDGSERMLRMGEATKMMALRARKSHLVALGSRNTRVWRLTHIGAMVARALEERAAKA